LLNAQGYDYPEKLQAYSKEDIKQYCWVDNKYNPSKDNYPKEWNNQSAIYLLHKQEYALRRIKSPLFIEYGGAEIFVTYLAHYRVKVLDEAAVKEFSEIHYNIGSHGSYKGFTFISDEIWTEGKFFNGRHKNILRIKVIKPDGTEVIVDKEHFIKKRDNDQKAAIPNLEIGDVLDYYCFTYDRVVVPEYGIIDLFPLSKNYPIYQFDYTIQTDPNWNIQYTSGEYPVVLKEKKIDAKSYEFSLKKENIERKAGKYWNNRLRSGPYIRLFAAPEHNFLKTREKNNLTLQTSGLTIEYLNEKYEHFLWNFKLGNKMLAKFSSYLKKKHGKELPTMEQQLEELHYFVRYEYDNQFYLPNLYSKYDSERYSSLEYTTAITAFLEKRDISYEVVLTAPRDYGGAKYMLNTIITEVLVRAELGGKYYYFSRSQLYTHFNVLPHSLEGANAYAMKLAGKGKKGIETEEFELPKSNYLDNKSVYKTSVTFDKEDLTSLNVLTVAKQTGHQRTRYQSAILDYVTMLWEEDIHYNNKPFGKSGVERNKDIVAFLETKKEEYKDEFEAVIKGHFDLNEDPNIISYEAFNTGNVVGEEELNYRFKCELNDVVQKVGPNYIIKAGLLVGSQLTLEKQDENRSTDIYMDYAKGFEYTLDITIPDGYSVKGLEDFNNNIENETGAFISSASLVGNKITIVFKKYYKSNYQPLKNWNKMKEFIIPAADFISKKILLKKNS
jgi:YHS domain-containing protein